MPLLPCIGIIALTSVIVCGITAIVNPQGFEKNARFWGRWIETRPIFPVVDHRVDIDSYVLQHTRVFGVAVLSAVTLSMAVFIIVA